MTVLFPVSVVKEQVGFDPRHKGMEPAARPSGRRQYEGCQGNDVLPPEHPKTSQKEKVPFQGTAWTVDDTLPPPSVVLLPGAEGSDRSRGRRICTPNPAFNI